MLRFKLSLVHSFLILIASTELFMLNGCQQVDINNPMPKELIKQKRGIFRKLAEKILSNFELPSSFYEENIIQTRASDSFEEKCSDVEQIKNYFFNVYSNNSRSILYSQQFEEMIRFHIKIEGRDSLLEQKAKQNQCKRTKVYYC